MNPSFIAQQIDLFLSRIYLEQRMIDCLCKLFARDAYCLVSDMRNWKISFSLLNSFEPFSIGVSVRHFGSGR